MVEDKNRRERALNVDLYKLRFKDYRDRPSIDKKSDKITKCNGYQPIHIRL
jgi:hypothetical protein